VLGFISSFLGQQSRSLLGLGVRVQSNHETEILEWVSSVSWKGGLGSLGSESGLDGRRVDEFGDVGVGDHGARKSVVNLSGRSLLVSSVERV